MNTTLSQSNEQIMREFNEAVIENGDMELLEEYLAPEFVQYDAGVETIRGIDAAREYFEELLTAFPESSLDVEELIADDDRVMMRYEITGTHDGPLSIGDDVLEPTGKPVSWQGFTSARIVDGKITEVNTVDDMLGMARQLGLSVSA